MIPKTWQKQSVGAICTSIVPGRNKPKIFNGNIPWVTTPEIAGRYVPSNLQRNYVSEEAIEESGGKIVPAGAVIMAAVGDLGLVAIAKEKVVLNQQLHAFVCSKAIDSEYLAYWLETQKPYMESVASKTTIPYMNKTNCESIPVLIPPFSEQKKIAQILSTWDQAFATTERLLDLARQQKKALMQQLLTGKKRFPGFEREWKLTSIAQMGKVVSGGTPDTDNEDYWNGEINWLTPTDVTALTGKYVKETSRKITAVGVKDSAAKLLPPGTLLICTRATIGAMAISTTDITTNQGFKNLTPNSNHCVEFLYFTFDFFVHQFIIKASGSTFLELSKHDFERMEFLIPSLEEQQKIASVLMDADQEIETLQSQLNGLKQEKKALMQALLTGKRRVKVDAQANKG